MPIRSELPSVVSGVLTRSRGAMRLIKARAHSATMAGFYGCSIRPTAVHSFRVSRLAMGRFHHYLTLNANQMLNAVVNNGFDVVINY